MTLMLFLKHIESIFKFYWLNFSYYLIPLSCPNSKGKDFPFS